MSTIQIKVSRRLVAELDDDEDSNDSLVAILAAAGSSRQRKFVPDDLASQISSLQASIETMSVSMTGQLCTAFLSACGLDSGMVVVRGHIQDLHSFTITDFASLEGQLQTGFL